MSALDGAAGGQDQHGRSTPDKYTTLVSLITDFGILRYRAGCVTDKSFKSIIHESELLMNKIQYAIANLTTASQTKEAAEKAAQDVLSERERQKSVEGWTPEHDDKHDEGQLAVAAGYYALACGYPHEGDLGIGHTPRYWPWDVRGWKPAGKRRNLVKAGALILAEIERLDRAAVAAHPQ